RQGKLEYGALERLLRRETKAIVCTHASNLTGDAVDLPRISAFAKAHGLLLVVDASQTAGLFPIDMEKDGIDVLCFTGHKGLYGPQGTGGLCVGEGVEIRPFLVGGTGVGSFSETQPMDYPTRLEAGTLNSHGLAGLSAALDWLAEIGVDTIRDHDLALARRFYREVKAIPGVSIYGDWTQALRAPIVALNVDGWDSALAADALAERFGIAVRPGAHCAPRLHRALGTEAGGAIRFSWSYFNTEAETDAALSAVKILAGEGR
ncbi:MAG: aminotransferase class V-fold PLP-dependent enzyme, partial [Oscillibacter sp.]